MRVQTARRWLAAAVCGSVLFAPAALAKPPKSHSKKPTSNSSISNSEAGVQKERLRQHLNSVNSHMKKAREIGDRPPHTESKCHEPHVFNG